MKSYLRAVRLCFDYRWTLIAAFVCSLMVAVLWGTNIGTVYPFIEVVFRGQSLRVWVDEEIGECRQSIARMDEEIAALRQRQHQADAGERRDIASRIARLDARRDAERYALRLRETIRPAVYRWIPEQPYGTLIFVVLALLVGTTLKSMFLMAHAFLVERSVGLAILNVRKQYFGNALGLDLGSLGEKSAGELTSRFTFDMNRLNGSLKNLLGRATVEPLKMIACLGLAGWVCWRLLFLSLVLAPLAAFLVQKLAGSIKRANRRAMEQMSHLVSQLSESLEAVQIVKAFTMEGHERSRFHRRAKEFFHKVLRIAVYNSLSKPLTELFGIAVISAALLAGGYLVLQQQTHLLGIRICDRPLGPEALIVFFALLAGAADPARKLADIYSTIQPGIPAAERVFSVIDRPSAIQDPPHPKTPPQPHRRIVVDDVSFAYASGGLVLRDVRLEIPFGETLAIVGPNGCGKSTLVNLLPRFYDPTAGAVRLDEVDLRQMRVRDLRRRIGLVAQHTQLFDDTVANNIRYGSLEASHDEVVAAARQAHAHRFIEEQLESGYETIVGPRGNRLSGGQRQRLALARAILRDPELLILDEATSQVDLESEQLIHQVLQQFIRGRTAIIITHRLSTLALADRILVLEGGRVLDLGTHQQLIGRCPLYQRLHEIHFRRSA